MAVFISRYSVVLPLLEYVASFGTHVAAVGHCTSDPSSSIFRKHRLYFEIRDVRTSTTSRHPHCIGVLTTSELYARDILDQRLTAVRSSVSQEIGLNQKSDRLAQVSDLDCQSCWLSQCRTMIEC